MSQPQDSIASTATDDISISKPPVPVLETDTNAPQQPLSTTTTTKPPSLQEQSAIEKKPLQPVPEIASPQATSEQQPKPRDSNPSTTGTTLISPPSSTDTTPLTDLVPSSSSTMPTLPPPAAEPSISPSPQPSLSITLLLISGARYPFTIDANFLTRHSISALENDPLNLGVHALKECIWKDWREAEWDQRPASAHFIRLIHFGRLLDDRQQLRDCRLNPDTPNVVHMTVRPAEAGDDDMTQRSTKMAFGRDGTQREGSSPSCRCVIL